MAATTGLSNLVIIIVFLPNFIYGWIASIKLSLKFEYEFCPTKVNQDGQRNGCHLLVCTYRHSTLVIYYPIAAKEALAIRSIFSLVDMITKAKFSNSPNNLKFVCLGSIICIVRIKIRSKAIHHLQSFENLRFLLPPLILRLNTGCRLDQNFIKSIIVFQKVKVLNY